MTVFDSNYSSRLTGRDDVVWIGASGAEFRAVGSLRVLRAHNQRIAPVSYTHLRAHETVLDLVCRLLLEKKNIILLQMSPHY